MIEEKIGGVSFYKLPDNCTEATCSGCFKSKQDNKEYYYTCTKEKGVYTCSLGDSIDEKTFCGNCTNGNLGIDDCSGYCVPDHCSSLDEKYVKDHKGDTLTDDHPAFDSGRKPSTYGKDILKYGWKKLHQVGRGCTVHRTDGASYYCTKGDRSGYDYMCAKAGTTPIAFYSKIWGYHAWGYPTSGNCPMITEDASAGARDITRGEYAQVSGHIWGCKIYRKYLNSNGTYSDKEAGPLYCAESERRYKLTSTSSWYCQTEQTEDDKQSVCHEEGQKASCSATASDGSILGGKQSFKDDACVWREKCYPSAVCKADTDCAGKCGEDCAGTCSCGEDGKCACEGTTECTTNSDCGSGEYCKILDDGNTNACNKTGGECVSLTNGNSGPLWGRMFYYQNNELMNKWTASNWCTAHGYQLASAEALHCKDGTCPEDYPWESLKRTFSNKGFWLSDGDDCSSYGAVTSAKTIGNYKNSNLGYAVCFIPCDGNYGSGTTQACTTTDRPRCSPGGYCKTCSYTSINSDDVNDNPICYPSGKYLIEGNWKDLTISGNATGNKCTLQTKMYDSMPQPGGWGRWRRFKIYRGNIVVKCGNQVKLNIEKGWYLGTGLWGSNLLEYEDKNGNAVFGTGRTYSDDDLVEKTENITNAGENYDLTVSWTCRSDQPCSISTSPLGAVQVESRDLVPLE